MSDFTVYIPMLLALVLALTLVTNLIVQVLKSLLYDWIPTNLLAFLVAAGAGFALWSYYKFVITGWMIPALVALAFTVAYAAMFGYDKLEQLVEQAGWLKSEGNKNE